MMTDGFIPAVSYDEIAVSCFYAIVCGAPLDQKHHKTVFDLTLLVGFYLIVLGMGLSILLEPIDWSERLFRLGMWVVIAFFLLTLIHGAVKGIHRTHIRIPVGPMCLVFSVSAGLFLTAWWLGSA
ncbi:MAG: hypothetical protein ACQES2_06635 [Pseudomonadota bacterium]